MPGKINAVWIILAGSINFLGFFFRKQRFQIMSFDAEGFFKNGYLFFYSDYRYFFVV